MIKIITNRKAYIWNYKKLIKNLAITVAVTLIVAGYFIISTLEYQDLLIY